ncbi:hypothetical protein QCA50_015572 [Cerrena zonata]|uniref:non-reducing end alpha-L-arabinofuranosidase n=1 Tax=Cerrena zonata TaxID=2478898 RepID=A0AAW0FJ60_9APHY
MEVTADHDQYAWFNLISLFPPTYKNRTNGLRKDLAEALHDLRPKHIRIPGGSNLQGGDISSRFNWTLSLGPLEKRPGRVGYWVGYQTEGLGLKELLDMCEDFGATPILGVYDGYAADDESVPNTHQLDKYIQSAVDELHFVLGDSQTNQWGQLRAELGHPEPYKLEYVEIGNEDFTSTTYGYRWQRFYDALKAAYLNVNYIASSSIDRVNLPAVDVHDFSGPDFFYNLFDRYDNWPRNGTIIWELENGVINTNSLEPFNTPETRLPTPTLQGSIAEAVFLIGMQRNGDLVAGSSYAPYLANNYSSQWTPNLINFNITHVALSTSYYVQRMVSHARAEKTHPVTSDTTFGPLYWIANNEQASVPVTGTIKVGASGEGDDILPRMNLTRRVNERKKLQAESTILAAGLGQAYNVTNDLDYLDAVVPVTQEITASLEGSQIVFNFTVPGWSFGVYRFVLY